MATDQERLLACDEIIGLLEFRRPISDVRRSLSAFREIRDHYASIVAKHNRKHVPQRRKISSREIAQVMWEDICR